MQKKIKRSQIIQKIIYLIILLPFFEVPYLIENYPISSKIYFLLLKPRVIKLFLPIKILATKVR